MKHIHNNPETSQTDGAWAESVSALADGALSGLDADAALAAAARPEGQERWQLYHLIGDTLRAPDLAAHQDATLLTGVRAAISEPVLTLAPVLLPTVARPEAANDRVFRWKLASGFAAVVAVAAIGWNVWGWAGAPAGQHLARLSPSQATQQAAPGTNDSASAVALGAQRLALSGDRDQAQMLRDPQLDQLLAAHRRVAVFGGDTSVFLRNATFEEPQR